MAVEPSTSIEAMQQRDCSRSRDPRRPRLLRTATPALARAHWSIGAVTGAASSDPDTTQALCINLRHLPTTTLELESYLGAPLATLLAELSAPQRLLVIDGADAISEGMLEPLRYLVDAGRPS